jgi:rod shape-determining protein MreC
VHDKNVVRRRRAVLALLIALSLALLTVYFGESAGGGLHAIQRGAQAVLSPIESGASRALKPFRDATGWIGDSLSAQGENDELRAEVAELRQQLAAQQSDQREVEQLRSLVDLPDEEGFPADTRPVTGRVIAQSPTVWYSTVQIDKGRDDGVELDQPVVTGDGLAGKVTSVTGGTAQVTLITDADSAVSAQVVPNGTRGIVRPQVGDPNDLLLDFLDKEDEVKEGATVVTSGSTSSRLESLFPRGVPIGEVTRVDAEERELYQRVHIEPFADLRRLDFVQVLTGDPTTRPAEVALP